MINVKFPLQFNSFGQTAVSERDDHVREMIELVRAGLCTSWPALIAAVEQALSLGLSDAAAVQHILAMPDPVERRKHEITLAAELAGFERPLPVMDDYDLLLTKGAGGVQ